MEGHRDDDVVVVGGDARQRLHDARGYGRPRSGDEVELSPVEAAHLLSRGDLEAVDGEGFAGFFAAVQSRVPGVAVRFLAYADLRSRGFYLSPAREGWVDDPGGIDFVVHPRGSGPREGRVEYRLRVVGEREPVPAAALGDVVLAVADEEGELTYFATDRPSLSGTSAFDPPAAEGRLLSDRVVVWDPPADLYRRGFYGQPLAGREAGGPLQLSLVEAAALARGGSLDVEGGPEAVLARGREVEGDRFDRRLRVYAALRERGLVPKTGFKFGADFRAYTGVESVDDLGHSAYLLRVVPPGHVFSPRELALDVRLAGGVRKELVFARPGDEEVRWLSVSRLTP